MAETGARFLDVYIDRQLDGHKSSTPKAYNALSTTAKPYSVYDQFSRYRLQSKWCKKCTHYEFLTLFSSTTSPGRNFLFSYNAQLRQKFFKLEQYVFNIIIAFVSSIVLKDCCQIELNYTTTILNDEAMNGLRKEAGNDEWY